MKTLRIFALTSLVAGFGLMTGCDSTSSTSGPTIKEFQIANTDGTGFNEATDSLAAGGSVAVWGEVTSDAGLSTVTVTVKDAAGATKLTLPNNTSATSYVFGPDKTVKITIATTTAWASGRYSVQLTATDKNSNSSTSSSLPLLIKGGTSTPTGTATVEKSGTIYNRFGKSKGAWSLSGDSGVSAASSNSLKELRDALADATTNVFDGSLISPAGATFVKANSFAYATATKESIQAAFTAGSATTSISAPAVNDIYLIKLSSTSYVALKVTAITPGSTTIGDNSGSISFSYRK